MAGVVKSHITIRTITRPSPNTSRSTGLTPNQDIASADAAKALIYCAAYAIHVDTESELSGLQKGFLVSHPKWC
eukprot:366501-Chlamydomonas_euryale.AAC.13